MREQRISYHLRPAVGDRCVQPGFFISGCHGSMVCLNRFWLSTVSLDIQLMPFKTCIADNVTLILLNCKACRGASCQYHEQYDLLTGVEWANKQTTNPKIRFSTWSKTVSKVKSLVLLVTLHVYCRWPTKRTSQSPSLCKRGSAFWWSPLRHSGQSNGLPYIVEHKNTWELAYR